MPFTPAHAAIVLPLIKVRRLSATGLIVGSIAPDFEYFFKFSVSSNVSHTWWGVLYFNVPVVLLLSTIFHLVVKQNLIENLPGFLRDRFQDTLDFDFKTYLKNNFLFFLVSGILGSVSHIFWDSFTHANGFFVQEISFYKDTIVPYDGARYPLYYALQHFSSVFGLAVILIYILLKKQNQIPRDRQFSFYYWVLIVLISGSVVLVRFSIYATDYSIGNVVVSSISGLCIALIVTGFISFRKEIAS